jgi:hypothetical protein
MSPINPYATILSDTAVEFKEIGVRNLYRGGSYHRIQSSHYGKIWSLYNCSSTSLIKRVEIWQNKTGTPFRAVIICSKKNCQKITNIFAEQGIAIAHTHVKSNLNYKHYSLCHVTLQSDLSALLDALKDKCQPSAKELVETIEFQQALPSLLIRSKL